MPIKFIVWGGAVLSFICGGGLGRMCQFYFCGREDFSDDGFDQKMPIFHEHDSHQEA